MCIATQGDAIPGTGRDNYNLLKRGPGETTITYLNRDRARQLTYLNRDRLQPSAPGPCLSKFKFIVVSPGPCGTGFPSLLMQGDARLSDAVP